MNLSTLYFCLQTSSILYSNSLGHLQYHCNACHQMLL
nr:MAG TPA: cytochrome c554 [Caudoviricetes sp.]